MLKKYVIKLSNSLNTINYLRSNSHSATCRKSDAGYCNCDLRADSDCSTSYSSSPIDSDDFNKNLFIENYCIKVPSKTTNLTTENQPEKYKETGKLNNEYSSKTTTGSSRALAIINRNALRNDSRSYKAIAKRRTKSLTSESSEEEDDSINGSKLISSSYTPALIHNEFSDKKFFMLV